MLLGIPPTGPLHPLRCPSPRTVAPQERPQFRLEQAKRTARSCSQIAPKDMLAGRRREIHEERDRKLEAARKMRKDHRRQAA